jgi:hypothetical protein
VFQLAQPISTRLGKRHWLIRVSNAFDKHESFICETTMYKTDNVYPNTDRFKYSFMYIFISHLDLGFVTEIEQIFLKLNKTI